MIYVLFAKCQPFCVACVKCFSLYIIVPLTACNMSSPSRLSSCRYVTVKLFCVGINFFSFLLSLSISLFFFLRLFPQLICDFSYPVNTTLQHFISLFPSLHSHSTLPSVSISPPDAGPQLCGVPVLLPTWAERLFPPGPPPGANNRAVPGQHQPLPLIQPQQQVGRTTTARNYIYETWWILCPSWFQKCWAAVLTVLGLNMAITRMQVCLVLICRHTVVGEQGPEQSKKLVSVCGLTLGQQLNKEICTHRLLSLFPSECMLEESEHND